MNVGFCDNDMNSTHCFCPCKNSFCLTTNSNSWRSAQALTSLSSFRQPQCPQTTPFNNFSLSKYHTRKYLELPPTFAFVNRTACPLQAPQVSAGTQAPPSHLAETEEQQKPGCSKFQPRINPMLLLTPKQVQCMVSFVLIFLPSFNTSQYLLPFLILMTRP